MYSFNPQKQSFQPEAMQAHVRTSERALVTTFRLGKGEHHRIRQHHEARLICLLEGSWNVEINGQAMIVRQDEGLLIPSGHDHSAQALEDSCALEIIPENNLDQEEYLWGV